MPEPQLRDKIRAWIRERQHWLIACDARERPFVDTLFAAVNRSWQPGTPKTRVEVLDLSLHEVDEETGAERCAGVLFVVAIPRAALSAEPCRRPCASIMAWRSPASACWPRSSWRRSRCRICGSWASA